MAAHETVGVLSPAPLSRNFVSTHKQVMAGCLSEKKTFEIEHEAFTAKNLFKYKNNSISFYYLYEGKYVCLCIIKMK